MSKQSTTFKDFVQTPYREIGPAQPNSFDNSAVQMKFHNTMNPKWKDVGAKTKVRPEKVVIRDTKTGKVYGHRTLIQKTTEAIKQTLPLLNETTKEQVINKINNEIENHKEVLVYSMKKYIYLNRKLWDEAMKIPKSRQEVSFDEYARNIDPNIIDPDLYDKEIKTIIEDIKAIDTSQQNNVKGNEYLMILSTRGIWYDFAEFDYIGEGHMVDGDVITFLVPEENYTPPPETIKAFEERDKLDNSIRQNALTLLKLLHAKDIYHEHLTESKKITLNLLKEDDDTNVLPDLVVSEIKKNIRHGAKDLDQNWKNALHLLDKAYEVANVKIPTPEDKKAWKQYEELIAYSVKELADTRGMDGPWRITTKAITEGQSNRRIFVEIPGAGTSEVDGGSIDDVIEKITNKSRRYGGKVKIEKKDAQSATISVWKDDNHVDTIKIKDYS